MCAFLAVCAYWAANSPEQDEHHGKVAPHMTYRVRIPCPPNCDSVMGSIKQFDDSELAMTKVICPDQRHMADLLARRYAGTHDYAIRQSAP